MLRRGAERSAKKAREQQAAAATILKVINRSRGDAQPVFDAIVRNAQRLIGGFSAAMVRVVGGQMHLAALSSTGKSGDQALRRFFPRPVSSASSVPGRAIRTGQPVAIADVEADRSLKPAFRTMARRRGFRSALGTPMIRDGVVVGAITVTRREAGPFSQHEVALLKIFAEQAVIAIENVQQFQETRESLERQTATAEILKVIASSPSDVQPVFDAIAGSARRLLGGFSAGVTRLDDGVEHLAAITSTGRAGDAALKAMYPRPLSQAGLSDNVIETRRPHMIADFETDKAVTPQSRKMARLRGFRSSVIVPMLRGWEVIGTIRVTRTESGPFSDHQVGLLQTFADQAVIAIENVRLFNETKEALDRQTATAEILKVISSSPSDLKPVFESILSNATKLCGAHLGILNLYDGEKYRTGAQYGGNREFAKWLAERDAFTPVPHSALERMTSERQPIQIADVKEGPGYRDGADISRKMVDLGGGRTYLAVPLVKENVLLGSISIYRPEVQPFTDRQIALVKTFADQAVIAIENVRLFNETREALERQTATAAILKVIASSPSDVQPVFDAIAASALRLFEGHSATVSRLIGDMVHGAALASTSEAGKHASRNLFPRLLSAPGLHATVIRTGKPAYRSDLQNDPDVLPEFKELARAQGFRSQLVVPMLCDGVAIGAIGVRRAEQGPFTDHQINLLKTFADQAVIAIENVRLFNETKEALERQTVTAEILKVISSSPTDVQPVFDAIVKSGVRLFGGLNVALRLVKADRIELVASTLPQNADDKLSFELSDQFPSARAILRREVIEVPDVLAEEGFHERVRKRAEQLGYRSAMAAPLLRENKAIGAITVTRATAGPFTDKQAALLKTFADQAVIAIENVRLFKELQSRTEALTKSVGQLTALGEVGQAISSTLDLETVLKTIVSRAVQLTGLDGGSMYEYDEQAGEFRLQAAENIEAELVKAVREAPVKKGEGTIGKTALTLEPAQVSDILDDSYHSGRKDLLVRAGYRAILAVPLLREDHLLGALQVFRRTPGPFAPEIVELLKTFATQSAMAIQNARLFREIAEKGKQLEEASRHKSNFLASMSHELRTPLNAILGLNEMVLGEIYGAVPAEMQPPLAQVQTSGKHLLRLINNVLDLAKIEAGRMELALADYSVQDVVGSVRSTLQPLAAEKGLEFTAIASDDIPLAFGDAGRITQCLMNLAGNSLKFTKEGKVEISAEEKDGLLTCRVADTGIGIAPEKIASLFTEFKQTDATIASEYGGTGLGLSISKKFVEMHGGRIWVESEAGKGSAFLFEIPLRANS